jgi:plastocyanin
LLIIAATSVHSAGCDQREAPPPFESVPQATVPAASAPAAPTAPEAPVVPEGPAAPAVQRVTIDNFTFTPATITVAAGTTVTWINHDDVPHTVTANDKLFASKALDTDGTFSHTFTAPGTYPYFCAVHRHMTGQIIVK